MILLAIDTCDARGSVVLLDDERVLNVEEHPAGEEYSAWLIPAVDSLLASANLSHADIGGYAGASGPGSFTGVRVGLTTLKAWAEAYGRPIAAVSRLEAMAWAAAGAGGLVGAFFDAQRGQVFGGLYRREGSRVSVVGEEMVAPPQVYLNWVAEQAAGESVAWVSLDPHVLSCLGDWKPRAAAGEVIEWIAPVVSVNVGMLGLRKLAAGEGTDPLRLDANYVRRSDAELFWKKSASS